MSVEVKTTEQGALRVLLVSKKLRLKQFKKRLTLTKKKTKS
jgi:hypothetical protein